MTEGIFTALADAADWIETRDRRAAELWARADEVAAEGRPSDAEELRGEAGDEQPRADGAKMVIDALGKAMG